MGGGFLVCFGASAEEDICEKGARRLLNMHQPTAPSVPLQAHPAHYRQLIAYQIPHVETSSATVPQYGTLASSATPFFSVAPSYAPGKLIFKAVKSSAKPRVKG